MTSPQSTPPPACLGDLEIADLIAGRLEGEERARAMRHLAECEACYEVYAEAQVLLTVESENAALPASSPAAEPALAKPLPFRPRTKVPRWMPAIAAGLTAGIALAWLVPGRGSGPASPAVEWPRLGLLPAPAAGAGPATPIPGDSLRGAATSRRNTAADFFLGVQWAHLEEAWNRRQASEVRATAATLREGLDGGLSESLRRDLGRRLQILAGMAEDGFADAGLAGPGELTPRLSQEMSRLGYEFDLGRFAEAGRLAAEVGSRDFFEPQGEAARYLGALQALAARGEPAADAVAPVATSGLRRIAERWPREPDAGPEDFHLMAEAFAELILAYGA